VIRSFLFLTIFLGKLALAESDFRALPLPLIGVTLDDISHSTATLASLRSLPYAPTARIVFDYGMPPSYYAPALRLFRPYAYLMGQPADSTDMHRYSVAGYRARVKAYLAALESQIDLWEIGNEVNGGWLGSQTEQKIAAAYDLVSAAHGSTALTFFYMGEPEDENNCIDGPGNDLFSWAGRMFRLDLPPAQRSAETEKIRLGLNYVFVSWYPDGCPWENPDWVAVFNRLAGIFPQAKLGFGELGTTVVGHGSPQEIDLIQTYYPLAHQLALPRNYVGGYFWWDFAEEMVPANSPLLGELRRSILAGPTPRPLEEQGTPAQ
jgi:hypothetical protein